LENNLRFSVEKFMTKLNYISSIIKGLINKENRKLIGDIILSIDPQSYKEKSDKDKLIDKKSFTYLSIFE
jgi:hypothetical protein